jgi:hypothetical protein
LLKTLKPVGNVNAGGGKSFRLPGSTNFKPDRGNKVKRIHSQEKITSIWELSMAGLIPYEHKSARATKRTAATKKRPEYDRVKTYEDHSNSARDFNWARQAASWGFDRNELIDGLKEESPTATNKGDKYVKLTVDTAIKKSKRWKSKPAAVVTAYDQWFDSTQGEPMDAWVESELNRLRELRVDLHSILAISQPGHPTSTVGV